MHCRLGVSRWLLLLGTAIPVLGCGRTSLEDACVVDVSPAALDFGKVAVGASATRAVTVRNRGAVACQISALAIGAKSDAEFALAADTDATFTLAPGEAQPISLRFDARDPSPPPHRTGTLTFHSDEPDRANVVVPLSAELDAGCHLTVVPDPLSFGNVRLNTTSRAAVTLANDGSELCHVSAIRLGAGSDRGFALALDQATSLDLAPGANAKIPVSFTASDSTPPHLRTGTLTLQTGSASAPSAIVPLSAYINTECVDGAQWLYTVDESATLSRFDPSSLTFTNIGVLDCPSNVMPFSMAVDQKAIAWVLYSDGNVFRVDTRTAHCEPTNFQVGQHGLVQFGMGFMFDPVAGTDTLYIAGGYALATRSTLATVSFPSLEVTPIGPVTSGTPELSGTGDGTLWGFMPAAASTHGLATLVQLDPLSGATLESYTYPTLNVNANWAMKFWGGSFWIFLNRQVYRVERDTPKVFTMVVGNTGHLIVGAGTSTCAPVQ